MAQTNGDKFGSPATFTEFFFKVPHHPVDLLTN